MHIHEQVTDQIFSHEVFIFSIVVIYILGGFNVFGVMYINLNPKVLVAAFEGQNWPLPFSGKINNILPPFPN